MLYTDEETNIRETDKNLNMISDHNISLKFRNAWEIESYLGYCEEMGRKVSSGFKS
jgi:hypothetical protein